jgi:hypothetical protein
MAARRPVIGLTAAMVTVVVVAVSAAVALGALDASDLPGFHQSGGSTLGREGAGGGPPPATRQPGSDSAAPGQLAYDDDHTGTKAAIGPGTGATSTPQTVAQDPTSAGRPGPESQAGGPVTTVAAKPTVDPSTIYRGIVGSQPAPGPAPPWPGWPP